MNMYFIGFLFRQQQDVSSVGMAQRHDSIGIIVVGQSLAYDPIASRSPRLVINALLSTS